MSTFYTLTDIDNLARSGTRVVILKPGTRLTPLARDRARELGLEIREEAARGPRVPPGYTYPPADQAHALFLEHLRRFRDHLAPAPILAQVVDDLIQAASGGPAIHLPSRTQLAMHGLALTKRRKLQDELIILTIWAHRLYGPRASQRRYDILWALAELQLCLSTPF